MIGNAVRNIDYVLAKSDVLNASSAAVITNAMEHAVAYRSGHSAYQILMFILGDTDNPTPDSKYQQALREIDARLEALKNNYYQMRKAENEIAQYDILIEQSQKFREDLKNAMADRARAKLQQEASEIEVARVNMQLDTVRKDTRKLIRELDVFVAFCNAYKDKLTFPPEQYMDNLNAEHARFAAKLGLPELANHALCMNQVVDLAAAGGKVQEKFAESSKILEEFKAVAISAPEATKELPNNVVPLVRAE